MTREIVCEMRSLLIKDNVRFKYQLGIITAFTNYSSFLILNFELLSLCSIWES